jgi:hypothetical protein
MEQGFRKIKRFLKRGYNRLFPTTGSRLHSPQISCPKVYHGSDYGGWTVCPDGLNENSIIYSFGVGDDASFDLDVIKTYGAQIFAFDPTPNSIQWVKSQEWPVNFHFFPFGVAAQDGMIDFFHLCIFQLKLEPTHTVHSQDIRL